MKSKADEFREAFEGDLCGVKGCENPVWIVMGLPVAIENHFDRWICICEEHFHAYDRGEFDPARVPVPR